MFAVVTHYRSSRCDHIHQRGVGPDEGKESEPPPVVLQLYRRSQLQPQAPPCLPSDVRRTPRPIPTRRFWLALSHENPRAFLPNSTRATDSTAPNGTGVYGVNHQA